MKLLVAVDELVEKVEKLLKGFCFRVLNENRNKGTIKYTEDINP